MLIKCPLRQSNGKVEYPISRSLWDSAYADRIFLIGDFSGSLLDEDGNKLFEWEEYLPDSEIDYGSIITPLAYRTRYTIEQQALLDLISIDAPTDATEIRLFKATLRQIIKNLDSATVVDLTDERVRKGAYLVLKALNATDTSVVADVQMEAIRILDTPVSFDELPKDIQLKYSELNG